MLFLKRSFSIPEIMLVVAIIGILASISFYFLNPVQSLKRSRDAVRFNDLNALRSALIVAVQNGLIFDSRCTASSPCDSVSGSSAVNGSGYVDMGLSAYLNQLPTDPKNNADFSYQFAHDGAGNFEIRMHLEASSNLDRYTTDGGNNNDFYEVGTKLDIL